MQLLEEKELKDLQEINGEFAKTKMALADVTYQQALIIKSLDSLKESFSLMEKELTTKYGADVVINLESGEISDKPEEPAKNAE
tara:strand:- start:741 stop:992 length:252 start_codon:yes stop_codon:yes gene_type:complete